MANDLDNNLTTEFVHMFKGNRKLIEQGAAHGWAIMVAEGMAELASKLAVGDSFADEDEMARMLCGVGYRDDLRATLKAMRERSGAILAVWRAADQFICDLADEYAEANAVDLGEVAATDAAIQERTQ